VPPRLTEAIVRGDLAPGLLVIALWALTAAFALRPSGAISSARALGLLALALPTSLVGLAVGSALAVPRVRYAAAEEPLLAAASGETWRRLRGPAALVDVAGAPDVAVPTLDAAGRWVLRGLLSGRALPGLDEAPDAPPEAGAPRVCALPGAPCRAWPSAWPAPEATARVSELRWAKRSPGALAYDVDSSLYLREVVGGTPGLELAGRISADAPEGPGVVFVLRRVHDGRFEAVRVVATPGEEVASFRLERASASLTAAPRVYALVARPISLACAAALPLGLVAFAIALARRARGAFAPRAHAAAMLVLGLSLVAPGLVAVASWVG
jgi:hypothetical protein